jgi:hypothetical protein
VPADRVTEAAAELGPVLDLLAAVQAECDRLREDGRRDAEETRAGAREQAARLLEDAERHAAGLRDLPSAGYPPT